MQIGIGEGILLAQASIACVLSAILTFKVIKVPPTPGLLAKLRLAHIELPDIERNMFFLYLPVSIGMLVFALMFRQFALDSPAPSFLIILQNLLLFGLALTLALIFFSAVRVALVEIQVTKYAQIDSSGISSLAKIEAVFYVSLLLFNISVFTIVLVTNQYIYQAIWVGMATVLISVATCSALFLWYTIKQTSKNAQKEIAASGSAHQATAIRLMRSQQMAKRMLMCVVTLLPIIAGYGTLTFFIAQGSSVGAREAFAFGGENSTAIPLILEFIISVSVLSIQLTEFSALHHQKKVVEAMNAAELPQVKASSKHSSRGQANSGSPKSPTDNLSSKRMTFDSGRDRTASAVDSSDITRRV
jgi:hypothetical protein